MHQGQHQTGLGIAERAGVHRLQRGAVEPGHRGDRGRHLVGTAIAGLQHRIDIEHCPGGRHKTGRANGWLSVFARLTQTQRRHPLQSLLIRRIRQNLVDHPIQVTVQPIGHPGMRAGQHLGIGVAQCVTGQVRLDTTDQHRE
ncbi:hypothetical protein D3C84_787370 [compost metagenome]